jgi:hypothetical protein
MTGVRGVHSWTALEGSGKVTVAVPVRSPYPTVTMPLQN